MKTQLKIIKLFIENSKPKTIREISKQIKADYRITYTATQRFIKKDILKIQTLSKRASQSASLVLPKLYAQPVITTSIIQDWTGFTRAGAQTVIDRFVKLNILKSKDKDEKYNKSFVYQEYINIFTND